MVLFILVLFAGHGHKQLLGVIISFWYDNAFIIWKWLIKISYNIVYQRFVCLRLSCVPCVRFFCFRACCACVLRVCGRALVRVRPRLRLRVPACVPAPALRVSVCVCVRESAREPPTKKNDPGGSGKTGAAFYITLYIYFPCVNYRLSDYLLVLYSPTDNPWYYERIVNKWGNFVYFLLWFFEGQNRGKYDIRVGRRRVWFSFHWWHFLLSCR